MPPFARSSNDEPPEAGPVPMLVGIGVGAVAVAILLLGLEAATGAGLLGQFAARPAVEAPVVDSKPPAVDRDAERRAKERIAALQLTIDKQKLQLDDRDAKVARLQKDLLRAEESLEENESKLGKLQRDLARQPKTESAKVKEPDSGAPAAVMVRASQPVLPEPTSLRRTTGLLHLTYTQEFAEEPDWLAVGFRGLDASALKAESVPLAVARRNGSVAVGTLARTRGIRGWTMTLAPAVERIDPTPSLQTGFVEVKADGAKSSAYYLTYRPLRFGPQEFAKPKDADTKDTDRITWRCSDLQYDLVRQIEDYGDYQANGGTLGFAGGARLRVDGTPVALAPPDQRPKDAVKRLTGANSVALELTEDGSLVLVTPKGTPAKTWTVESVAVVRPLGAADAIRSDHLLVFEIHPNHGRAKP